MHPLLRVRTHYSSVHWNLWILLVSGVYLLASLAIVAVADATTDPGRIQRRILVYQDISGSIIWERKKGSVIEGLKRNEYYRIREYLQSILFSDQFRLISTNISSDTTAPGGGIPLLDEIVKPAPPGFFPVARDGDSVCFYWFGQDVVNPSHAEPCQTVKDGRVGLRLASYSQLTHKQTNYRSMELNAYKNISSAKQSSEESVLWIVISDEKPDIDWTLLGAITSTQYRELIDLRNQFVETEQFRVVLRTQFLSSPDHRKNEIYIRVVSVADKKWLEEASNRLQKVEREIIQLRREIEQAKFDSAARRSLLDRLEKLEAAVRDILVGRETSRSGVAAIEKGVEDVKAEMKRRDSEPDEEKRKLLAKIFNDVGTEIKATAALLPKLRPRVDDSIFHDVESRLATVRNEFNRLKALSNPVEGEVRSLAENVRGLRVYIDFLLGNISNRWFLWILLPLIAGAAVLLWGLFAGFKLVDPTIDRRKSLRPVRIWRGLRKTVLGGQVQSQPTSNSASENINFILEFWPSEAGKDGSLSDIEIRSGLIRVGEKIHLGNKIQSDPETQSLRIAPLGGYYLLLDDNGEIQILPAKASDQGIPLEFGMELKRPINGIKLRLRKVAATTEAAGRGVGHVEH